MTIAESTLAKLEKMGGEMQQRVRDLRAANKPEEVEATGRALGTAFLLQVFPGGGHKALGISLKEVDALAGLCWRRS
jgi:hypothetical protein